MNGITLHTINKLDDIKSRIEELRDERKKLLRGLGYRFSRKIKPLSYDKQKYGSLKNFDCISKERVKRAGKGIKHSKNRIENISDDIADLKQQIKELEIQNMNSSSRFNESYRRIIKRFN
jgi:predicted  nucleic acid-binding Zn-ribbon protein